MVEPLRVGAMRRLPVAFVVAGAKPGEARESLEVFRQRYNEVRPHWALVPPDGGDSATPAEVYVHRQPVGLPKWQGWAKAAREKLNAIIEDAHFPSAAEPAEVTA